jgi:hypothetical protein
MTIIEVALQQEPQEPQHLLDGRVLHLVDVENLVGTAHFSLPEAVAVRAAYEQVAPGGSVNQIILATSHHAGSPTWFGWPGTARRLVRSGRNGADLALLDILDHESVESRFQHVVVGSGDGIFALPAARLQAAGCGVTVVTRRGALSRQLRLAVRDVRYIELMPAAPAIAAVIRVA